LRNEIELSQNSGSEWNLEPSRHLIENKGKDKKAKTTQGNMKNENQNTDKRKMANMQRR